MFHNPNWDEEDEEADWNDHLNAWKLARAKGPVSLSAQVTVGYKTYDVGRWQCRQYEEYEAGSLTADRVNTLSSQEGWEWTPMLCQSAEEEYELTRSMFEADKHLWSVQDLDDKCQHDFGSQYAFDGADRDHLVCTRPVTDEMMDERERVLRHMKSLMARVQTIRALSKRCQKVSARCLAMLSAAGARLKYKAYTVYADRTTVVVCKVLYSLNACTQMESDLDGDLDDLLQDFRMSKLDRGCFTSSSLETLVARVDMSVDVLRQFIAVSDKCIKEGERQGWGSWFVQKVSGVRLAAESSVSAKFGMAISLAAFAFKAWGLLYFSQYVVGAWVVNTGVGAKGINMACKSLQGAVELARSNPFATAAFLTFMTQNSVTVATAVTFIPGLGPQVGAAVVTAGLAGKTMHMAYSKLVGQFTGGVNMQVARNEEFAAMQAKLSQANREMKGKLEEKASVAEWLKNHGYIENAGDLLRREYDRQFKEAVLNARTPEQRKEVMDRFDLTEDQAKTLWKESDLDKDRSNQAVKPPGESDVDEFLSQLELDEDDIYSALNKSTDHGRAVILTYYRQQLGAALRQAEVDKVVVSKRFGINMRAFNSLIKNDDASITEFVNNRIPSIIVLVAFGQETMNVLHEAIIAEFEMGRQGVTAVHDEYTKRVNYELTSGNATRALVDVTEFVLYYNWDFVLFIANSVLRGTSLLASFGCGVAQGSTDAAQTMFQMARAYLTPSPDSIVGRMLPSSLRPADDTERLNKVYSNFKGSSLFRWLTARWVAEPGTEQKLMEKVKDEMYEMIIHPTTPKVDTRWMVSSIFSTSTLSEAEVAEIRELDRQWRVRNDFIVSIGDINPTPNPGRQLFYGKIDANAEADIEEITQEMVGAAMIMLTLISFIYIYHVATVDVLPEYIEDEGDLTAEDLALLKSAGVQIDGQLWSEYQLPLATCLVEGGKVCCNVDGVQDDECRKPSAF